MGYLDSNGLSYFWGKLKTIINGKQDTLVSGTNIKTINNESLLGSGNITIQGGGGQQQQADWAQTDSSAIDYIKNKPSANTSYFAAWTASSSAANGARLTDTLTLPEGIYIIRGQYPATSKSISSLLYLSNATSLYNVNLPSGSYSNCFYVGSSYLTIFEIIFVGQGGGEVYLATAQSASTTYTLLERGFIAAIKIA